jgi:hypothetical protein
MTKITKTLLSLAAIAALALFAPSSFAAPGGGIPQASITLQNCDAQYCYTHNNTWTLTKAVTGNTVVDGKGTVTWTVTAIKSDGGTTFTVHGGLTILNSGTAPATIGNIVVNLQKPNGAKISGKNVPWVSAAADVANATSGDAATAANIVAGGSAESQPFNTAFGAANYVVSGAKGKFTETAGSGALEFTDASDNTIFSLVPQPVIPVGGSVTLLYDATFNTSILVPGTAYRVETLVTFGNAGLRGGAGATASSIDVNGNDTIDTDEANVRTVPCRITLAPLPAAASECNDSVTVSDLETDVSTTGTVTTSNPSGFGSAVISDNKTFPVSVDVNAGTDGGRVCNEASLNGVACGGTLSVITGYTPDEFVDITPDDGLDNPVNIGHQPIYATYECAAAASASASDCADIGSVPQGFQDGEYCTYTKGGFGGPGAPGQLYDNNFLTVFSSGLALGIEDGAGPKHDATWAATGQSTLKQYLTSSAGGQNTALTADTDNATSTSGGNLPRQTATLTLNIGFNAAGLQGTSVNFGSLTLCNLVEGSMIGGWTLTAAQATALSGTTILQVLADANNALGGNGLPSYVGSFGDLNQLVTALNESFDNCGVTAFATAYLCK